MPSALIEKGKYIEGRVRGRKGQYKTYTFQYEPAYYAEIVAYQRADRTTPEKQAEAAVKLVKGKVTEWTINGLDQPAVPVTEEDLKKLWYTAIDTMIDIISGGGELED